MIAGTRQKTIGGTAYRNDPLYAFGKAFTEAANDILTVENFDLFAEPSRAIRSTGAKEALKEFLKDGIIDANERREIESLKVKYGISTEKANALEQELKPKTEKINFSTIEKLNLTEATEIFYELGNAKKPMNF